MKKRTLPISVDSTSSDPLYQQVFTAIRSLVLSGMLRPGQRLPPGRELARQLGVNLVTTARAYRELAARGWVTSRVGQGTFVCSQSGRGSMPAEATACTGPFPLELLRSVINEVIDEEGAAAFAYDDAGGYWALREALLGLLRADGFTLADHEIVVFSGAQQGLSILLETLVNPGDWVLIERPTYPGIVRLLEHSGARVESVDLGPSGPDPRVLDRLFRTRPFRLAYVMPTFQNPTGICYSDATKAVLAQLCREHGVVLIEDDAFSDLDYGSGRQRPLRAVSGSFDDGVYLKSFSHVMLPGLRLGFCLCSPRLAEVLRHAKAASDLFSPGFFQRVLTRFISRGHFSEHVLRLEAFERRRLAAVVGSAEAHLVPCGVTYVPPAGGATLWCRLPSRVDCSRFHAACAHLELPVSRGSEFSPGDGLERHFAVAFGSGSLDSVGATLRQLALLVADACRDS